MKLIMDNSALAALSKCTTQALVRYHLNLVTTKAKTEDAPRNAGKAIHAGIAHWLRGGTMEECLGVIEVIYKKFAQEYVSQKDKRMLWPNVEAVARSWFLRNPLESLPFEPLFVELPFRVEVNPQLMLTGLIDCIGRDKGDGRLYVVEHKSTGQRADWWMGQWQIASQLSQYVYGANHDSTIQQALKGERLVGSYVNKIDAGVVPSDPVKKCKEHPGNTFKECGFLHPSHEIRRYARTAAQLDDWLHSVIALSRHWDELRELVETINDVRAMQVRQEGLFNGSCTWCDLKDWCLTGRKNNHIFREEPWAPIQG